MRYVSCLSLLSSVNFRTQTISQLHGHNQSVHYRHLELPPVLLLANVPVLAEDTAQVAHPKEDGARPIPALKGIFMSIGTNN